MPLLLYTRILIAQNMLLKRRGRGKTNERTQMPAGDEASPKWTLDPISPRKYSIYIITSSSSSSLLHPTFISMQQMS